MPVYCMDCKKLHCEDMRQIMRTGWVIVDLDTGEVNSNGEKVNYGYHATGAEMAAGAPKPQTVQV